MLSTGGDGGTAGLVSGKLAVVRVYFAASKKARNSDNSVKQSLSSLQIQNEYVRVICIAYGAYPN